MPGYSLLTTGGGLSPFAKINGKYEVTRDTQCAYDRVRTIHVNDTQLSREEAARICGAPQRVTHVRGVIYRGGTAAAVDPYVDHRRHPQKEHRQEVSLDALRTRRPRRPPPPLGDRDIMGTDHDGKARNPIAYARTRHAARRVRPYRDGHSPERDVIYR